MSKGRTSSQIRNAPRNSMFIWCDEDIGYPINLARALDRRDINVCPASRLAIRGVIGYGPGTVVIDHRLQLNTAGRVDAVDYLESHGTIVQTFGGLL